MDDAPPWLQPDELHAWITMIALLETFPTAVDAQLKRDSGLNRFEYTVLAMLSENEDHSLVMSDLADVAIGSISRLSHAVTRLENRGLVERRDGAGGRRHKRVHLTDAGLSAITDAAPPHVTNVKRLLVDPLSPSELATFSSLVRKLIAAADPAVEKRLDAVIDDLIARNDSSDNG